MKERTKATTEGSESNKLPYGGISNSCAGSGIVFVNSQQLFTECLQKGQEIVLVSVWESCKSVNREQEEEEVEAEVPSERDSSTPWYGDRGMKMIHLATLVSKIVIS